VQETNFRRAMENSMLTGMRALDLEGRITYVNAAFCSMTGFTEAELVGLLPPFPTGRTPQRRTLLAACCSRSCRAAARPGGIEVKVMRKDGSMFDARMYVSPLIAPRAADRVDDER
jgi:PAS domain S-box-containing protein